MIVTWTDIFYLLGAWLLCCVPLASAVGLVLLRYEIVFVPKEGKKWD